VIINRRDICQSSERFG